MENKRQYRALSDSTKMKISQALKGRSKSSSTKEKISSGLRNYWEQVPNKPTDN